MRVSPSVYLYRLVRAGFVKQGVSLGAYCRSRGIRRQNARSCLIGEWTGAKAQRLVQELIDASQITK